MESMYIDCITGPCVGNRGITEKAALRPGRTGLKDKIYLPKKMIYYKLYQSQTNFGKISQSMNFTKVKPTLVK
jgi:hypothetical protein